MGKKSYHKVWHTIESLWFKKRKYEKSGTDLFFALFYATKKILLKSPPWGRVRAEVARSLSSPPYPYLPRLKDNKISLEVIFGEVIKFLAYLTIQFGNRYLVWKMGNDYS